jgi:hypothetical protein
MSQSILSISLSFCLFCISPVVFWWGVYLPRKRSGQKFDLKFTRRERRRLIVSLILTVVSVMIFASSTIISFEGRPIFWACYMLGVLILLLGTIMLAFFDSLENIRHLILSLSTTRREMRKQFTLLDAELKKQILKNNSNNGSSRH